ncbi:hypothetical protein [Agaribacter marinus]|nr:hypothetical protein [Agaribacter marinus]
MLYLKSASSGLLCVLCAGAILLPISFYMPNTINGINIDIETWVFTLLIDALQTSPPVAKQLTWILLTTVAAHIFAWLLCKLHYLRLNALSKKHQQDSLVILMAGVLSDSPLDAKLFESYAGNEPILITLSNRKVYVGVVSSLGEPTEVEGMDQEINLVPIMSGYRDSRDLTVTFNTEYQTIEKNDDLMLTIRQDLIETITKFDFDVYEEFTKQKVTATAKTKVTFNPKENSFTWFTS